MHTSARIGSGYTSTYLCRVSECQVRDTELHAWMAQLKDLPQRLNANIIAIHIVGDSEYSIHTVTNKLW